MSHRVNAFVTLRTEGVGVIVDLTDGRLPALLHWGPDPGAITVDDAAALALTAVMPAAPSMVDEPTRLSILPEQWAGWLGRPGLSGSRADGSAWSPKFVTHTLLIDGEPTTASGDAPAFAELGAGTVEVLAADAEAGLELSLGLELTVGGLLRSQARLTNSGQDGYRLDDLILAYPVPTAASDQSAPSTKSMCSARRSVSRSPRTQRSRPCSLVMATMSPVSLAGSTRRRSRTGRTC